MHRHREGTRATRGGFCLLIITHVRALAQVALALEDVATRLDFEGDAEAVVAGQLECVKRVRQVLNITRLQVRPRSPPAVPTKHGATNSAVLVVRTVHAAAQDGVDRRRESRSNSVARLITYGQGHCHGLTSCMAAVLHAFSPVLGIDVAYVVDRRPRSLNGSARTAMCVSVLVAAHSVHGCAMVLVQVSQRRLCARHEAYCQQRC